MAGQAKLKDAKVVWVNSWRDIPLPITGKGWGSIVKAYHDPNTNTIYAIKGVTTKAQLEHEKYHSLKGHEGIPADPVVFVRREFEAHKYAYDKIGQPKHIKMTLRGIFDDITETTYTVAPREAIAILEKEFNRVNPPETWREDFRYLKEKFVNYYGIDKTGGNEVISQEIKHEKKSKNLGNWWEQDMYKMDNVKRKSKVKLSSSHLLYPDLSGKI